MAFANLHQLRAGGLVIGTDPFFVVGLNNSPRWRSDTRYPRSFAAAGGLMSYGGSITDAFRGTGVYTGRILKGEKPADLPVQQVTKVELFINLKTAMTLGIEVPPPQLSARAHEVIE